LSNSKKTKGTGKLIGKTGKTTNEFFGVSEGYVYLVIYDEPITVNMDEEVEVITTFHDDGSVTEVANVKISGD